MIGKANKIYAAGILLIGLSSITCFILYILGVGGAEDISVKIEDALRTAALFIFACAGYMMYKNQRHLIGNDARKLKPSNATSNARKTSGQRKK
jgi:hypothetical protein